MSSDDSTPETPPKAPEQELIVGSRMGFPVLPLRDIVVFPHMIVPLFVGRVKSVRALEDVMAENKHILLVAQKNPGDDDPNAEDIQTLGTVATVLQLLKLPDDTVKVLVEGTARAQIETFVENESFFEAEATVLENQVSNPADARDHRIDWRRDDGCQYLFGAVVGQSFTDVDRLLICKSIAVEIDACISVDLQINKAGHSTVSNSFCVSGFN